MRYSLKILIALEQVAVKMSNLHSFKKHIQDQFLLIPKIWTYMT